MGGGSANLLLEGTVMGDGGQDAKQAVPMESALKGGRWRAWWHGCGSWGRVGGGLGKKRACLCWCVLCRVQYVSHHQFPVFGMEYVVEGDGRRRQAKGGGRRFWRGWDWDLGSFQTKGAKIADLLQRTYLN